MPLPGTVEGYPVPVADYFADYALERLVSNFEGWVEPDASSRFTLGKKA